MNALGERLLPIEGFYGYLCSCRGNIYSIKSGFLKKLKPYKNKQGYLSVVLMTKGEPNLKSVHRLIADTFLKNPISKPQVNHKDCNKSNNKIENLEWVTQSENMKHAFLNKRNRMDGENHPQAKLDFIKVKEIRRLYQKGLSYKEISIIYNIDKTYVSKLVRYKRRVSS